MGNRFLPLSILAMDHLLLKEMQRLKHTYAISTTILTSLFPEARKRHTTYILKIYFKKNTNTFYFHRNIIDYTHMLPVALPYLNVPGDQIKKLRYCQDASHASTACFFEAFNLLATSLLQLCVAPQLQYFCSFQQLFSLHSGNSPSMTCSITVFKGLYQWLLSLFPFLWKLKFLETLCLQTAAKKTGFIQCAILPSLWPLGATGFSKSPTRRQMGQLFHPRPLAGSIYRNGM